MVMFGGGGGDEARNHNHAATNDTAAESTCNASRMSHPFLYDRTTTPTRGEARAARLACKRTAEALESVGKTVGKPGQAHGSCDA